MFERYTEKARRSIFFARYEASQLGSQEIATEHLLLGLLRDDPGVFRYLDLGLQYESVRAEITSRGSSGPALAVSVDLPLAEDAKRALKGAAEEADRLNSRPIGTEHLLLAMLRDSAFPAAQLLIKTGVDFETLQRRVSEMRVRFAGADRPQPVLRTSTTDIHGLRRNADVIYKVVAALKQHPFYWERKRWAPRDIVHEKDGLRISFDLSLAKTSERFLLVPAGWRKDLCHICAWELFESDDPSHGTGFTNGYTWVCEECYHRFIEGDYFRSPYPEMT